MFVQLDPIIPVNIIGKGEGYAFGMIDYGPEHNLIWVTALNDSGEIWSAPNPDVRFQTNWTMGRRPLRAPDRGDVAPGVNDLEDVAA